MRNSVVRATGALAFLVLAAACGGGSQRTQPAATAPVRTGPMPIPVAAPPIFGLFGQRETLGLTSDQINRLEGIAITLRERNDSLETQLRTSEMNRGRARTAGEQRRRYEEALPSLEVIWANNRRAMEEAGQVLTAEQRDRVCGRQREREAARGTSQEIPGSRQRPMMSRTPTDTTAVRRARGWSWCSAAAPRPAATSPATTPAPGTPAPAPTPAPTPTPPGTR